MSHPGSPIPDAKAASFESVVRLRKGGNMNVFYAPYDCQSDSCGICTGGLIDLSETANIQECVESLIQDDVVDAFMLKDGTEVRLKDVGEFVELLVPPLFVMAIDVEFTAK